MRFIINHGIKELSTGDGDEEKETEELHGDFELLN